MILPTSKSMENNLCVIEYYLLPQTAENLYLFNVPCIANKAR